MQKLIFCLLLVSIFSSTYGQDKKDWRGFVEINFGVTTPVQPPNYSITSPYLKNPPYEKAMPCLIFKAGVTFKRKHFWALGIENFQVSNGFFYERMENDEYVGTGATPNSPYTGIGIYYDYKIVSYKRFHILAGVQTSLGFTDPGKTLNDSISGGGSSYNPFSGVTTFTSFKQNLSEKKNIIFAYSVGVSGHFEIIKEKLILGIGAKFVHAPYSMVKSYHVTYQYNNEAPFDFYTSNSLMNMNFDLRLKYVF